MRVVHETISREPAASLSCRDFDLPVFDCPYHRHQEFEVLRIDQSEGWVLAGDYAGQFKPGEIYVFGSKLPHAFINRKGTRKAVSRCLQFDPELLITAVSQLPEMQPVADLYRRAERGLLLSGRTADTVSRDLDALFAARGMARIINLFRILQCIEQSEETRELASEGYSLRNPDRHLARLESVLTHIHEHSVETLTIPKLARLAGMSETSLHRLFRQRMGCTPGAYIQDVRLAGIAHRLLESEASISEIAFAAGFNNLSNFNRQFRRRFQCTPREYRAMKDSLADS